MRINESLITFIPDSGAGSGSVTSVGFSATVPTGLSASVSGSPITTAGTIALSLSFAAGYAIPTTIKQSNWDDAYTWVAAFPTQTGNSGKYLTTNGSSLSWATLDLSSITGTLPVTKGGTGVATLTGVVIGNGTSNFTAVTGGPNQILRVNGTATGYEFYTASFLTNPMTLNFDMIYQSGGVPARLAGNITTTKQFLTSIGNGTATTSLSWASFTNADVPGAALTSTNDTNVQITLGGTPSTAVLRATSITMGWTGQLAVGRGGTGASTLSGVLIGNATSAITGITGIGGQILRANPSTGVYEFWTPTYMQSPFTATAGQIIYSNSAGAPLALNPNSTANNMYLRSVSSGTPAWATIQGGDIVGAGISRTNDTNVQITLGGATTDGLLRAVTLTMGWSGQLAVGRGGTGVATITGVVIGNGTSNMTAITGTAGQLLRRNTLDTAYEFWTPTYMHNPFTTGGDLVVSNSAGAPLRLPPNVTTTRKYLSQIGDGTSVVSTTWETVAGGGGLSGSGTTNYVSKWTGTSALGNSIIQDDGTNVGIGVAPTKKFQVAPASVYSAIDTGDGLSIYNPLLSGANLFLGVNGTGGSQGALIQGRSGTATAYQIQLQPFGGNVGIGINPSHALDVNGNIGLSGTIYAGKSGNFNLLYDWQGNIGIWIGNNTSAYNMYSNAQHFFTNKSASTTYALMDSSGTRIYGKVVAGTDSATNGSIILQDSYSNGNLTNICTNYSSGNPVIGFGVTTSSVSSDNFVSATGLTLFPRGALSVGQSLKFFSAGAVTATIGSAVAMNRLFEVNGSNGQMQLPFYTTSSSFSGTPQGYLAFDSAGNVLTVPAPTGSNDVYRMDFSLSMPQTWNNMPSALSFFNGSTAFITAAELTNYTQVRLLINKLGTAGASGSIVILRYSATYTQNVNLWSAIGTSSVQLSVNATNSFLETAWIDLVAGAKGDVFIALMGSGGDGAADPIFGMIAAEFR